MKSLIDWNRVIFLVVCMTGGLVTAAIWAHLDQNDAMNIATQFGSNFIAAMFGAMSAFWLQAGRDDRKDQSKELAEVNLMIIGLAQRLGALTSLKKGLIDPIRNREDKAALLRPARVPWPNYKINYDTISRFLSGPLAECALDISVSDQEYSYALEAVQSQNELHGQFQDLLGKSLLAKQSEVSVENARSIAGEKLWANLEDSSAAMIKNVDRAVLKIKKILDELPVAYKRMHRGAKVVSYQEVNGRLYMGWI